MFPTLCQQHACFNQGFRTNNDLEGNNRRLNALAKDMGLVPLRYLLLGGHQLCNCKKQWVQQEEKVFSLWRRFIAGCINVWELLEDLSKLQAYEEPRDLPQDLPDQ